MWKTFPSYGQRDERLKVVGFEKEEEGHKPRKVAAFISWKSQGHSPKKSSRKEDSLADRYTDFSPVRPVSDF